MNAADNGHDAYIRFGLAAIAGAEKSPDNWLTREFFRANERIESLPPHARPIQVRTTPAIETKETQ